MKITYWRAECFDNAGNHYDECEMTESEMREWYEWHKDEFLISADMTFGEFIEWQGFEELTEWEDDYSSNCHCDTYGVCGGYSCPNYHICHA